MASSLVWAEQGQGVQALLCWATVLELDLELVLEWLVVQE